MKEEKEEEFLSGAIFQPHVFFLSLMLGNPTKSHPNVLEELLIQRHERNTVELRFSNLISPLISEPKSSKNNFPHRD